MAFRRSEISKMSLKDFHDSWNFDEEFVFSEKIRFRGDLEKEFSEVNDERKKKRKSKKKRNMKKNWDY